MRKPLKRILLQCDLSRIFDRKALMGVTSYLDSRDDWEVQIEALSTEGSRGEQKQFRRVDGIIASFDRLKNVDLFLRRSVPMVTFGPRAMASKWEPGIHNVSVDEKELVSLAFRHLKLCGFSRSAFCCGAEEERNWYPEFGLLETAESSIKDPENIYKVDSKEDRRWETKLAGWLKWLPKPIGIFASSDSIAYDLAKACRKLGYRMPNDVGIVGINNDDVLCSLSSPQLTSVDPNAENMGYLSASLLGDLIEGKSVEQYSHFVEPAGVRARGSTRSSVCRDPDVEKAVGYIGRSYADEITPSRVSSEVGKSRTTLEMRFKKDLGRTIYDQIRLTRLQQAEYGLRNTDLPIKQVSQECGFSSVSHMTTLFRQHFGMTPATMRRRLDVGSSDGFIQSVAVA